MGRGHCLLNILGHEAAHRLLFPNRRANDLVGRWLLAYPTFQAFSAYRRVHFAHHRDELGPDEPDTRALPRLPDRRRLVAPQAAPRPVRQQRLQELQGHLLQPAQAQRRGLADPGRPGGPARRRRSRSCAPLAYVVWIVSWSTLWKFSNRLRAIAEHGGMERSSDRRRTTHVIRQTPARPLSAWCRTTPAGTSPTTSTWACRGATCPALHDELCAPAGSCPTSSTRRTGRSGRPARPASHKLAERRPTDPPSRRQRAAVDRRRGQPGQAVAPRPLSDLRPLRSLLQDLTLVRRDLHGGRHGLALLGREG